jgi:serine/threonine protein kinase
MNAQQVTNEQWATALQHFEEVLESSDPERIIARQSDAGVRAALRELWLQHQEADKCHFLEDQITIVPRLLAPAADVFVPEDILDDRFTVLRLLGRGGMGEVYLAADKLLTEMVALKTIRRDLARDEKSRTRFLEEVHNSRRVTHPNVCRIFDVFEHGGSPFLSMKYLAGLTLGEILKAGPLSPVRGRSLAIQVAEGLAAAHREGILHCDLKPANIIVEEAGKKERAVITDFGLARALERTDSSVGGTLPYMAPELKRGEPPTVLSDIYAFGKVLDTLLPKHRLVAECLAEDPARRPKSMEAVVKELDGGWSRRQLLLGALVVSGTSWSLGRLLWRSPPPVSLGTQQRVKVNGFQSDSPQTAHVVRSLFIMALRQSPYVSILGDSEFRSQDKLDKKHAGFALPLDDLLSESRQKNVGVAIDGNLQKKGNGLRLTIRLYEPGDSNLFYTKHIDVDDARRLVALAENAATNLRLQAFGESTLHDTYVPLEQLTSASPEALDSYFRAVAVYEKGESEAALILLDRALSLDHKFVLGHHYRALSLSAQDDLENAMAAEEIAVANRLRVTERERNWIDGQYANLSRAFDLYAEAMNKNTVLFPDEAIFQRQHAFALMRLGRYDEAIPHNRTAVDLDPFSENNVSELLVNLAEAGRAQECFDEAKKQAVQATLPTEIHQALAIAHLQAGQYEDALTEARRCGAGSMEAQSESRLRSLPPLVMLGRFPEAILSLEGDLGGPDDFKEHTYKRRNTLGWLHYLQGNAVPAAEQAEYLVDLPTLATNLIHLRQGCALAFELKQQALLKRGLAALIEVSEKWPSHHSRGAVSATQAMVQDLQGDNIAGASFARAKIEWSDPINLFYVAHWEGKSNNPQGQLADLDELERLRGKIFKYHFAGLVVLIWLQRAKCLRNLTRFEESLRMYQRVEKHWGSPHVAETLMDQARKESAELKKEI